MSAILSFLTEALWSLPMLVLLMGTHLYFTLRLGIIQRLIPRGIRLSFTPSDSIPAANASSLSISDSLTSHETSPGSVSPYGALATALAATIGTGNIIGISTAIAIGGPGAVFWCWLTGILGIATCYSECLLSMLYRVNSPSGQYLGGPMYILKNGLHKKYIALLFSIAVILVSFGMGSSVQSHSIASAITRHFPVSSHVIGILVSLLAGFAILGGIKQISRICTFFVPFMSLFYLVGCFWILFLNRHFLCDAVLLIFQSAFSARSFAGGLGGTAVMLGIRTGISRGLFTNEAGLGSIPMAAASSSCSSPVTQSLISMTGPFWDTVVICAITGLVVVSSILKTPAAYINIPADGLCFIAFAQLPLWGEEILSISLILFAFATILGWCYYGECGVRFLWGERGVKTYQILYLLFIYLGAVVSLQLVWGVSDLLNILMTLPNLLCLWLLRKKILEETRRALH